MGHYYGIIRYEMQEDVNVEPIVRDNIEVTGGSGTGLKVSVKVYKKPSNNQFAAAEWAVTDEGKGYKDNDQVNIPAIPELGFDGVNGLDIATDSSAHVTDPWPVDKNFKPI